MVVITETIIGRITLVSSYWWSFSGGMVFVTGFTAAVIMAYVGTIVFE